MSVAMPRMTLMACLLSLAPLWPSLSQALGLGEIHLKSALNEPLNAEIDLIAATPDELTALRAALASRDAFTRYGIDRPPFLSSLTFKVGKSKDGRDVLLVHSSEAIPEPFVTFLVEVNWARGRLMREYTVLLDPPVYTPGEAPGSSAPVTAATSGAASPEPSAPATPPAAAPQPAPAAPAATTTPLSETPPVAKARHGSGGGHRHKTAPSTPAASPQPTEAAAPPAESAPAESAGTPATIQVAQDDTLTKIARSLHAESRGALDQTMMALYRNNPAAFGGSINVLKRGAVLRVPDADAIAALNEKEAISEVHRQLEAWRNAGNAARATASGGASGGRLRLVTPTGGGGSAAPSTPASSTAGAETQALRDRVKDLEGQLAESKRLLDIKSAELSALQQKLAAESGAKPSAAKPTPPAPVENVPPRAAEAPPPPAATPPAAVPPPAEAPPVAARPAAPPVKKPAATAPAPESGSWIDWVAENWWIPAAILAAVIGALGLSALRKRRQSGPEPSGGFGSMLDETHVSDMRAEPAAKLSAVRNAKDSYEVEESGPHAAPEFHETPHFSETGELKSAEDTLSSESAVNIDQGDPLAEADFHMAYGLYDQAADLVRIALEREPDRRDLRMKLLEIYFVWGNKDAFLQTAKGLEATRDRAPAGEWDKIVIMGKQICPEEPMFFSSAGSGRGAGALVDLNLEGGENRVDIDLFGGEPEAGHDGSVAKESDSTAVTGESPALRSADLGAGLDFMLEAPERDADDSPTREMPPRDEPTIESELMQFDSPTTEAPVLQTAEMLAPRPAKAPGKADQTAEVSIDALGLNLDHLEQTDQPSAESIPQLAETDHPSDAPTMVAGLDERSRRMMEEAAKRRENDLTELERELEASFIAELDPQQQDEIKTAVLPPESAPTVLMPREREAPQATVRVKPSAEFSDIRDPERVDVDSTSKLRGIKADSIDLDLDRLATELGSGDTVDQPRAAEDLFSSEVFEASQRSRRVDLDVGEALNGAEHPTNRMAATNKLKSVDLSMTELEPVTMSEVGTKLDLARAYMDMGDPEGARSILEEVVQEGSASQKQEASRLIESLPG